MKLKLKEQTNEQIVSEAVKNDSRLKYAVEAIMAEKLAEERKWIIEEIKQDLSGVNVKGGQDSQYALYQALETPRNVEIDLNYIKPKVKITEEEKGRVNQIYASIAGSDAMTASSIRPNMTLKKYQTETELRVTQLVTNTRYNTDPYIKNILENFKQYILGNGFKVTVPNVDVQNVLLDFIKDYNIQQLFLDFILTSFKDGEVGINIKNATNKKYGKAPEIEWELTKILSEEIRGFEFNSYDAGKKMAYFWDYAVVGESTITVQKWIADINYWRQFNTKGNPNSEFSVKTPAHDKLSKNSVMLWFQHGDIRNLRGRVPLESILRDARLLEDFKINRAILNYERSKVLYIKKNKQQINRKDSTTELRKSPSPKGGVMLTLGPNEDLSMVSSNLQASDADKDGMLFLYAISSGTNIPVYMLGGRIDLQNYSSVKNTDSPFNQTIYGYANLFAFQFGKLFTWVIKKNVETGFLPKTIKISKVSKESKDKYNATLMKAIQLIESNQQITDMDIASFENDIKASLVEVEIDTEDIPLEVTLTDATQPNPLELAKTAFIERKLGIVSSQTLSEERGRDWAKELYRIMLEKRYGIMDAGGNTNSSSANAGQGLGDGLNTDTGSGTTDQNAK